MSRRDDPVVRANRALQITQNPEFDRAFNEIREGIVNDMEKLKLDGANDAQAASLIYKLQAAKDFKAQFVKLVLAGDRAVKREERQDVEQPFDPQAPTQQKGK